MTTLDELVAEPPAADRGVPAGFEYGAGVWRHVLELADPSAGSAVVWHDLTAVTGLFTGYDYTRGSDGYQGRYRASVVNLDFYADDDSFAPWNPDTSATFGVHVALGPGLLLRSGFIRVDGGTVAEWNPRWTCKVESWGDTAYARGRVRIHRVTARDTLSSLVNVPIPARGAENWFERFVHLVADSGWPYGWVAYGARHLPGPVPVLELPDRSAASSAINELDALLDPAGLTWYTNRLGQLVVRPKVNDTFHAAAFGAGADGTPWVDAETIHFAWWVCQGEPPGHYEGRNHATYAVDTPGVDAFGFDATDRSIVNHVKVTDPTGPGFDDDDPVSIERYDRKSMQLSWIAPNDTVAADLLTLRANAAVEARPLHTNNRLDGFHLGPASIEYLDPVAIVHRNTDAGLEVFGDGWLRSYVERVGPLGCDTDWSMAFTVDIYTMSARDTVLLPVEDLTLVGLYDTAASFTWTNPAQAVTPTHTQIRMINPASLWQTVEYPLDGLTWSGLTPSTGYEFQVRLLRIVDGLTTHFSAIRAVSFVTLETEAPYIDDDGDVILPPPDAGCVVEWRLERSPDGAEPWFLVDSGVDDTAPYGLPAYDFGSLDPEQWYRFVSHEDCAGVDGPDVISDPFVADCMGADRLDDPPYDHANLVAYWPEVCPNRIIREAVSNGVMIPGHALDGAAGVDGIQSPVLWSAERGLIGYQIVTSTPLGSHDLSIGCGFMIGTSPATETFVFEYGGASISIVADEAAPDPDAAGFRINGNIKRAGDAFNTVEGETIFGLDTVHDVLLTHDPGTGALILYVDGVVEAAHTFTFGDRVREQMRMTLPAASWITDAAAWDVILVIAPPPLPTGPLAEILALTPILYHTCDDLASGVFANHGSLGGNGDMKDWNTASGLAGNVTMEEQAPFTLATRLVRANGECLTMHPVTVAGGFGTSTTYSVFAKFADSFPLPAHMTLSANGNSPLTFPNKEHWFYVSSLGAMLIEIYNASTLTTFNTANGVVPNDGEWHMLSAVFVAGASIRFYVDGVEVFAQTSGIPASKNNPSQQKSWGGLSNSNTAANMSSPPLFPFNGWLAHCFIENSAVSAATLLGIKQAALG